ncbi:MAG: 30S ribosomal protein S20 [Candidatus Gracilibacteria bacterium]
MPIIKSAKKQLRQSRKRRAARLPFKNLMKTTVKTGLKLIREGKVEEAKKFISEAYKMIDMACKKHMLHPNNANRKKSLLARNLNDLIKNGPKKIEKKEKVAKKEKVEKKVKAEA